VTEADIWTIILGGMVATFLTRLSFILLLPQSWLSEPFERVLRFVPPAVLSAIILPELLVPAGSLDLSLQNHRLLAGALAALAAWRLQNTWITIGVGMLALWLLSAFA
jgi:branched-subunit amino acid transport protein